AGERIARPRPGVREVDVDQRRARAEADPAHEATAVVELGVGGEDPLERVAELGHRSSRARGSSLGLSSSLLISSLKPRALRPSAFPAAVNRFAPKRSTITTTRRTNSQGPNMTLSLDPLPPDVQRRVVEPAEPSVLGRAVLVERGRGERRLDSVLAGKLACERE